MIKNIYKSWFHGHDDWKWSEDCKCYLYRFPSSNFTDPPSSYCLGNRMIWCQPGLDSYGVLWRGSLSEGWGCMSFSFDLGKAIRWVQQAEAPLLGSRLWETPYIEIEYYESPF